MRVFLFPLHSSHSIFKLILILKFDQHIYSAEINYFRVQYFRRSYQRDFSANFQLFTRDISSFSLFDFFFSLSNEIRARRKGNDKITQLFFGD